MSAKPADILNKMKSKRNGAETFMETMHDHKHESQTKNDNDKEHIHVHEHMTEQFNEPATETESKSKSILEKYKEKKKKEDLFTRQTYLIRNDLIKRFDKAAATRKKGFKTDVINELLEAFLNENNL